MRAAADIVQKPFVRQTSFQQDGRVVSGLLAILFLHGCFNRLWSRSSLYTPPAASKRPMLATTMQQSAEGLGSRRDTSFKPVEERSEEASYCCDIRMCLSSDPISCHRYILCRAHCGVDWKVGFLFIRWAIFQHQVDSWTSHCCNHMAARPVRWGAAHHT